jgi:ornithine cyclodeaminase/alanine dehydrogenase-like protein (mu-crystallin family)
VGVWSRTPEHRRVFAERAQKAFGVSATAYDEPGSMLAEADIVATATNAREPLVRYEQLRPGTHVTSAGLNFELDASVYRDADQLVAASRQQEVASAMPTDTPGRVTGGPLYDLLSSGALMPESIVELGAIVRGDVVPRNGQTDINVYRESRGGVGDAALASRVYDLARARGLGTEFDLS